ncbi:MAG TPA: MBL fold metallo-hydrolase, partial [Chloroflexota bacterium]
MRVDFVGHAALLLRLGRLTILTDPWWASPAFKGQWCPYPLPVTDGFDPRSLDAVYISHAHEDHLHRDTLREILAAAPDVLAVIPRRYDTLMRDYLVRIGFRNIREVASGTRIQLRKGAHVAKLRVFTHLDDSLLSVEYGGQVLLNANDALHSAPRELIEAYCRDLRRRLPHVDYLFCGFGGASYFPNCVHVPGKDDVAVAQVREEFFLRNFALVARRLHPRFAFPFAAHFVLPNEHNWWISARRLSMPPPSEIVRRVAPDLPTQVVDLQPGDWVEGGDIHASAYPGGEPEAARREVIARYGPPATIREIAVADFERLIEATRARVEQRIAAAPGTAALDAVFRLWDYPAAGIHIAVGDGRCQVSAISLDDLASASPEVVFETRSDLL